jgi:hypothetical protein
MLLERFADGLSPVGRMHPRRRTLDHEIQVDLVHPDMDARLLEETAQIITTLFSARWSESWLLTMRGIVNRVPFRTIVDANEEDCGVTYERSGYFIYSLAGTVFGTAGFYQDLSKSDRCYGGLFAMSPSTWGTPAVYHVFRHVLETIRDYQRVPRLEIFTADSLTNKRVHQFYERNFFERMQTQTIFRGEVQRFYCLDVRAGAPIWGRLDRIAVTLAQRRHAAERLG